MNFERNCGLALIITALLLVITMVLHPVAGNIEHLFKSIKLIVISHSIALLCIPFYAIGFFGLTRKIGADSFLSLTAFFVSTAALIGGMLAALVNGLAMPIFLIKYQDATPQMIDSIRPMLKYSLSLNHALDFLFIGGMCLSTLLWSLAILSTKKLNLWIGYFGIALSTITIVMFIVGFVFTSLQGFRLFIFGNVAWTIMIGINLLRPKNHA